MQQHDGSATEPGVTCQATNLVTSSSRPFHSCQFMLICLGGKMVSEVTQQVTPKSREEGGYQTISLDCSPSLCTQKPFPQSSGKIVFQASLVYLYPYYPLRQSLSKGLGSSATLGLELRGMPRHRIDLLLQDAPTSNFCLRSSAKENTSLFAQVPLLQEGKDWISKELMIFGVVIPLYHRRYHT